MLSWLREAGPDEARALVPAAALAGLSNAFLVILIGAAAQAPGDTGPATFIPFALVLLLHVLATWHGYRRATSAIEARLQRIKTRAIERLSRAGLEELEALRGSEVYAQLAENTLIVSVAGGLVVLVLQAGCVCVCALVYIAWLSPSACALLFALLACGVGLYRLRTRELTGALTELTRLRVAFLDGLGDLLRGFKEVKLRRRRCRDLSDELGVLSGALSGESARVQGLFDDGWIFANANLFALLGALVFVLPAHVALDPRTVGESVAVILFLWGPLACIVRGVPAFARAEQALRELEVFEARWGQPAGTTPEVRPGGFSELVAERLEYGYAARDGEPGFAIGPVDLRVAAGEVVFVVGGNGSGKSTLLKVLTGLYAPSAGALRVDGAAIHAGNVAAHRERVSAIFGDFHLFQRLYGLLDAEAGGVNALLQRMGLAGKTGYEAGRFSRLDLSTGQRKRLALIVALLEDRPLIVFDEWAADQDPEFRRYFYDELLPELRRRGKAVLAVSHDDHYFHRADRVLTLEYGQVRLGDAPMP